MKICHARLFFILIIASAHFLNGMEYDLATLAQKAGDCKPMELLTDNESPTDTESAPIAEESQGRSADPKEALFNELISHMLTDSFWKNRSNNSYNWLTKLKKLNASTTLLNKPVFDNKQTLLHRSVRYGILNFTQYLIGIQGINLQPQDGNGKTPIQLERDRKRNKTSKYAKNKKRINESSKALSAAIKANKNQQNRNDKVLPEMMKSTVKRNKNKKINLLELMG